MRAAVGSPGGCLLGWRPQLRGPVVACPAVASGRAVCVGRDLRGCLSREGGNWECGAEASSKLMTLVFVQLVPVF